MSDAQEKRHGGRREGAGRKRISEDSTRIFFRISKEDVMAMDALLEKAGCKTLSELARTIIQQYIKENSAG